MKNEMKLIADYLLHTLLPAALSYYQTNQIGCFNWKFGNME